MATLATSAVPLCCSSSNHSHRHRALHAVSHHRSPKYDFTYFALNFHNTPIRCYYASIGQQGLMFQGYTGRELRFLIQVCLIEHGFATVLPQIMAISFNCGACLQLHGTRICHDPWSAVASSTLLSHSLFRALCRQHFHKADCPSGTPHSLLQLPSCPALLSAAPAAQ